MLKHQPTLLAAILLHLYCGVQFFRYPRILNRQHGMLYSVAYGMTALGFAAILAGATLGLREMALHKDGLPDAVFRYLLTFDALLAAVGCVLLLYRAFRYFGSKSK